MRLETGRCKLIATGFKLALNFIEKILTMDKDRNLRICFIKLKRLSENRDVNLKFNWCAQKEKIFKSINKVDDSKNITLASVKANKLYWLTEYKNFLYMNDMSRLCESRSLLLLPHLTVRVDIQEYFKLCLSLKYFRVVAQLRLLNVFQSKIRINNTFYNWKCDGVCNGCGLLVNDFSYHVLIECVFHNEERKNFITDAVDESSILSEVFDILNNPGLDLIKRITEFIQCIVIERENNM